MSDNDEIQLFYSAGLFSPLAQGQILAQDRLITYELGAGEGGKEELSITELPYASIDSIINYTENDVVQDGIYIVSSGSDQSAQYALLQLSTSDNDDDLFLEALSKNVANSKTQEYLAE